MTEDQLNKAVAINEERKNIKLILRDIKDEEICIYTGSQKRLDVLGANNYERIKNKVVSELEKIHDELSQKINLL